MDEYSHFAAALHHLQNERHKLIDPNWKLGPIELLMGNLLSKGLY
jgi:hypothetical protein